MRVEKIAVPLFTLIAIVAFSITTAKADSVTFTIGTQRLELSGPAHRGGPDKFFHTAVIRLSIQQLSLSVLKLRPRRR